MKRNARLLVKWLPVIVIGLFTLSLPNLTSSPWAGEAARVMGMETMEVMNGEKVEQARQTEIDCTEHSQYASPWAQSSVGSTEELKIAEGRQPSETVYHGNVKSRVFHRPGCQHYNCKNCTAVFKTREEAIGAGYRPCKLCNP